MQAMRDMEEFGAASPQLAERAGSNNPFPKGHDLSRSGEKYKRQGGENSMLKDALAGDIDARSLLTHEKPVHRLMAEMAANGYSEKEIAEFTHYTVHHVSDVLRQPWAREHTLRRIKQTAQDEILQFLEAEVMPSLRVIRDIRDDEKVPAVVRGSMAEKLAERFLGKPVQPMQQNAKPPSDLSDDELRQQITRELTATQPN